MPVTPRGDWNVGRLAKLVFSLYAIVVFGVLWVGVAAAALGNSDIGDTTWRWLQSLPTVPQLVVWVLVLPIAFALWAWQADLAELPMIAVVISLVVWTILPVASLIQAVRDR